MTTISIIILVLFDLMNDPFPQSKCYRKLYLFVPQLFYMYKGLSCFNKRCIRTKCRNDEMCNKLGGKDKYTCVSGKCIKIETCTTNEQCKEKYSRKYACVRNVCRKVME